jgi:hypothetical protein
MNEKLTPEAIMDNWEKFLGYVNQYISEPRKTQLLDLYSKYSERLVIMPASYKREYHNCFPGGYIDHVNRVVEASLTLNDLWSSLGANTSLYTVEELVFSALNHDLGKMGDETYEAYIPQTDQWRKDKLGEDYMFNENLPFASIPDRTLFLLQQHNIKYTFNEMIAIQTHDGLYDEGNKKYLTGFMPGQKPRTCLPYIIHQADLMASRIEFEKEYLYSPQKSSYNKKPQTESKSKETKQTKVLKSIKSDSLRNMLDDL